MAEVRLTPSLPMAAPAAPARAGEAVRAAQRAFFDAALNAAQASSPPRPLAAAAIAEGAATPASAPAGAARDPAADPRGLRPGSLIDIRV